MNKHIFFIFFAILFGGCVANDYRRIIEASLSNDPSTAFKVLAKNKSIEYASNPKKLSKDIENLEKNIIAPLVSLIKSISGTWGDGNVIIPSEQEYVKYMQNYKSRALVDFDKGVVTVETIDSTNTKKSLKNAIISTLLLPDDPRSVDLFSSKEVKLGDTPYLFKEIQDDQGKAIRYMWRASRFADILLRDSYDVKSIDKDSKSVKVHYVKIPMVKDHSGVRISKFKPYIKKYAKEFDVSENLIYAIIRTESNFNQFAVSQAGAFGLMQIVPSSAGADAYKFVKGKSIKPSKSYLFDADNNIELGVAYIHILKERYLRGIKDEVSKEYCVISAYNTGTGNVLKTFHKDRQRAKEIINLQGASKVYEKLRLNLPYEETRRYLKKVIDYKRDFVNL